MDYCHPCRRHLNGALACPGCGSPATLPAHADARTAEDTADPSDEAGSGTDEVIKPGRSRKSRRVQRRRRRRVVFVGAGLVLALGALSLAQVSIESPFRSSPDAAALGDGADGGTPSGDDSLPAGASSSSSASSAGDPGAGQSSASATQEGTGEPRETGEPSATKDTGRGGDGRDDDPEHSARPGPSGTREPGTGNPPPASNDPPPATSQPPASEEPDPQPTRSCTWVVVWWCS